MSPHVPFARPYLTGDEGAAVAETIATGWVSQGPRVQAFEAALAERVGAADAVVTSSCTTALHLALHAAGVGPGDEVVVPSLSFIATANAIRHCGARPVFADIDPRTYNLDPSAAERAITSRTTAIMPVHQVGLPADMDAFLEIARRHHLALVEDAACAIGARYRGRPVGSIGSIACFSLHPRKVITTGEGGFIAVQDKRLAERLRRLRQHGMSVSDLARHRTEQVVIESYAEPGFNYRMTDMQAALGLCQLRVLDDVLERRRVLAERYTAALDAIPGLEPPYDPPYAQRTWQSYCVRVAPAALIGRNELMEQLLADGIVTRRGVMAIHLEEAYAMAETPAGECAGMDRAERARPGADGQACAELVHTQAAAREVLMLPLFPGLTFQQQDYVIARLSEHLAVRAAA
jgi:perosamine synthetase